MASRRRSVSSILSLQATVLVVLTVCALAWVWQARTSRVARVEAPSGALLVAEQKAREATVAPFAFAATGDPAEIARARDALAEASAGLGVLGTLLQPDLRSPAAARTALDRLEAAVDASLVPDLSAEQRTAALGELEAAGHDVDSAFARVRKEVDGTLRAHEERVLEGLMALWLGVLVVNLGSTLVTRWFVAINERITRRTIHRTSHSLAELLDRAAVGEELPALPEDPLVQPLIEAAGRAAQALEDLRVANSHLRRTTSFTQELVEALQLAENERALWVTAERATSLAAPGARFQALHIDEGSGDVRLEVEDGECACAFHSPERCPAILKGRALHHLPGAQLKRCPRLTNETDCVTCAPIHVNGRAVAIAQVMGYEPSLVHFEDFEAMALALGPRLGVVRRLAEREQEAATDALTGLANRRLLTERLNRLDMADFPYAIVAADLDHFKDLNDAHGHAAGDACLKLFAQVLRDASRDSDLPARIGGEEFIIVLPSADMKAGLAVAMRVKSYLARAAARTSTPFTVSLGVAARPEHGQTADAVLHAADNALYDAKAAGRDAVMLARSGPALELVAD